MFIGIVTGTLMKTQKNKNNQLDNVEWNCYLELVIFFYILYDNKICNNIFLICYFVKYSGWKNPVNYLYMPITLHSSILYLHWTLTLHSTLNWTKLYLNKTSDGELIHWQPYQSFLFLYEVLFIKAYIFTFQQTKRMATMVLICLSKFSSYQLN